MDTKKIIEELQVLKKRKDEIYKRHLEKIDRDIEKLLKKLPQRDRRTVLKLIEG